MTGPALLFTLAGCALYLGLMSAVGKWLAASRERSSVASLPPPSSSRNANRERITRSTSPVAKGAFDAAAKPR